MFFDIFRIFGFLNFQILIFFKFLVFRKSDQPLLEVITNLRSTRFARIRPYSVELRILVCRTPYFSVSNSVFQCVELRILVCRTPYFSVSKPSEYVRTQLSPWWQGKIFWAFFQLSPVWQAKIFWAFFQLSPVWQAKIFWAFFSLNMEK